MPGGERPERRVGTNHWDLEDWAEDLDLILKPTGSHRRTFSRFGAQHAILRSLWAVHSKHCYSPTSFPDLGWEFTCLDLICLTRCDFFRDHRLIKWKRCVFLIPFYLILPLFTSYPCWDKFRGVCLTDPFGNQMTMTDLTLRKFMETRFSGPALTSPCIQIGPHTQCSFSIPVLFVVFVLSPQIVCNLICLHIP